MDDDVPTPCGIVPDRLVEPGSRRAEDLALQSFEVDLTTRTVSPRTVRCEDLEDALGGIARSFKLFERWDVVADAYDPAAPLVMNLGALTGTAFMTGLRTYFTGYSPLKSGRNGRPAVMWSAGSGKFGTKLRWLGVEEVVFRGRARGPVYLHLTAGDGGGPARFAFEDASDLQGLRVGAKIRVLHERYPGAHMAVIGPAGESFEAVRYAAIALSTVNQLRSGDNKARFCGRGGFGGVLGSKNLLAIVADVPDLRQVRPPDLRELNNVVARGEGSRRFRDRDRGNGGGGTWANYQALHPVHALPENNFMPTGTGASAGLQRPEVEKGPYEVKDEACFACGIRCHKNVHDRGEDGSTGRFRAKLDYEPLNLLSSNIGVFDVEAALDLVEAVDDLGMDSISVGVTLSYVMEYNRRHPGDGGLAGGLAFGEHRKALEVIEQIGTGHLARLGQGSKRLSEELGETGYAMQCKGVEFPAYLPQTNPGYPWALAGGHMSMRTYLLLLHERETGLDYWVDAITRRGPKTMRDDIIGICKFAMMSDEQMARVLSMLNGLAVGAADLDRIVTRTYLRGYRLERRAGFTGDDYAMPLAVHEERPEIQLPHFNGLEFFERLRERVCRTFDEMLEIEGL